MLNKTLLATAMSSTLFAGTSAAYELDVTLQDGWPYETGIFDDSAAEIVAYDQITGNVYVTSSGESGVNILSSAGAKLGFIDTVDNPNSVAVNRDGLVAVAVEAATKTDPGQVQFYNSAGVFQGSVTVGALPDMLTFTADGMKVLVANEGEPDGGVDPEGSISIVDISGGVGSATVSTADFNAFDSQRASLAAAGVRIFDSAASVSADLEPEYIAIAPDGVQAFVSLQEANSVAVVNIASATVTDILPLGTKDHSLPGNALDPSDRDSAIAIANHPVKGMFMPDTIASYEAGGTTYFVTANEGDARDEDDRVGDLTLDPNSFPDAAALQQDEVLGRLEVSTIDGDTDGDGDYDELYAYGARSFSIWDAMGNLVFDSGDDFEQITAALLPAEFNSTNDENGSFDARSDAKGPEPEALAIGEIDEMMLAFIGLERIGGIMVYDITDPTNPFFVKYFTTRDFTGDAAAGTAGALGPEGLYFVPGSESFNDKNLLIVGNEVSGTAEVFAINKVPTPATVLLLALGLAGLRLRRS